MTTERRQILEMLSEGKINADEAERLLELAGNGTSPAIERKPAATGNESPPRYLRVTIEPISDAGGKSERVNVRVPLGVLKAGVNLATLLPTDATVKLNASLAEKGFNVDIRELGQKSVDELISALSDLNVDVIDARHKVRVYVE